MTNQNAAPAIPTVAHQRVDYQGPMKAESVQIEPRWLSARRLRASTAREKV